jgi:hypothetical protein
MRFEFDDETLANLIRKIIAEIAAELCWPPDRIALTESEAAAACGVGRHVLRDLRLAGKLNGTRLGRGVVYTRTQLLNGLESIQDMA